MLIKNTAISVKNFLFTLISATVIAFVAGYLLKSCNSSIKKNVIVYEKNGQKYLGILKEFKKNEVLLEDHTVIPLALIEKIEFISDSDDLNSQSKLALTIYEKKLLGRYKLKVGNYKGSLVFFQGKTNLVGMMQFDNWGSGKKEYLKSLEVTKSGIKFLRKCEIQDCVKLGFSSEINQKYSGEWKDDKLIGIYTGPRSGGSWSAEKK